MADGGNIGGALAVGIGGGILEGLMIRHQRQQAEREKQLAGALTTMSLALKQAQESGNAEAATMIFDFLGRSEIAKDKEVKGLLEQYTPLLQSLLKGGEQAGVAGVKGDINRVATAVEERKPLAPAPTAQQTREPLFPSPDAQGDQAVEQETRREALAQRLAKNANLPLEEARARFGIARSPEPASEKPVEGTVDGKRTSARYDFASKQWIDPDTNQPLKDFIPGRPAAQASFQHDWVQYQGRTRLAMIDPKSGKVYVGGKEVDPKDVQKPPTASSSGGGSGTGAGGEVTGTVSPLRPDPATANRIDPKTGYTPNAIFQSGVDYALTGKMPSMGLGSAGQVRNARSAIVNKASAMATAAGTTLSALKAQYTANAKTLNQILPRYTLLAASSATANENLALALDKSAALPRSSSRVANRFMQWAQGALTGPKDLAQFETYVYTAAREYARVTTGGAASIAQLNVAAAKKADEILNVAQNPEAFAGTVEAMQNDMQNVTGPLKGQIDQVSGVIGNFLSAAYGDTGGTASASGGGGTAEQVRPIPGSTTLEAVSTDGGKTWKAREKRKQ